MAYLADTSAWVKSRQRRAPAWLKERFNDLLEGDEVVMCDMVKFELLHNEDAPQRFTARRADLDALRWCPIGPPEWLRALDVANALSDEAGARHRAVKTADYLIAAAAESAGLTVLHYDADYDSVASITGQPVEWVAPRGSL